MEVKLTRKEFAFFRLGEKGGGGQLERDNKDARQRKDRRTMSAMKQGGDERRTEGKKERNVKNC